LKLGNKGSTQLTCRCQDAVLTDSCCAAAQEFFANAPGVLFRGLSYAEDMEKAWGCFRHLRTVFQELEECRAFELLKVLSNCTPARPEPYRCLSSTLTPETCLERAEHCDPCMPLNRHL